MSTKKGELEVTIIEARNLEKTKNLVYCSVEIKNHRNTTNAKLHHTSSTKDGKWNQTFNLELMSLEGEELLVQVWNKHNVKKDKLMGQFLLRISALNLGQGAQWYKLVAEEHKSPDWSPVKKRVADVVSGEVLLKLDFVHRLVKTRLNSLKVLVANLEAPPSLSLSPPRSPPPISPKAYIEFQVATKSPRNLRAENVSGEVVIANELVDNKSPRKLHDKLEYSQGVRNMTLRKGKLEISEGDIPAPEDNKVEKIKKNMSELQKIFEPTPPLASATIEWQQQKHISH